MRGFPRRVVASSLPVLNEISQLATDISDKALLPVLGAGASVLCEAPSTSTLADRLWAAIDGKKVAISSLPSDEQDLRDAHDLGAVADVICLEHKPVTVVEELGFRSRRLWPGPAEVRALHDSRPHDCGYRIFARMIRERLLTEAVTFNYDCHFEGALLKEGFNMERTGRRQGRWPEFFDVVADERTHSLLHVRGDFVLDKVHGCVETWRNSRNKRGAAGAIIVRWSQLLDWRHDYWARDLFRDRARRHIVLVVGFGGADAVIHSALAEVMSEVCKANPSVVSRVRVLDRSPRKLRLRMLIKAGGGKSSIRAIQVGSQGRRLPDVLLLLLAELLRLRFEAFAAATSSALALPGEPAARVLRLTATGPAMMQWTYGIVLAAFGGWAGIVPTLDKLGVDYYVPLTAEPSRALKAFETREAVAARLGIDPEGSYTAEDGSLRRPVDVRAWVPLGLFDHEVGALKQTDIVNQVSRRLAGARDLKYVLVANTSKGLVAHSVETGRRVDL